MKVYVETYGCTLNQADSDIIKGMIKDKGYELTSDSEDAEILLLNTCTVKGSTENKIFSRIKEWKDRKLVVAGCLTVNEKRIREIKPDVVIMGTGAINKTIDVINDCCKEKPNTFNAIEGKDYLPRIFTKPILRIPIQDGCTSSCNFCQTKLARPKLISYNKKRLIDWITEGVKKGAREIQLTGMDCGAYGLDRGNDLVELMNEVQKTPGEFKVRVGMLNPLHAKRMLNELIEAFKGHKFYKFLHIPIQTGSEKVCKEMNRLDTVKDFKEIIRKFRKEIPEITIATDIIVGYPTENEEDFQETINVLNEIKPDIINISKFTPRPGTKAKELKQLDSKIIKKRSVELWELHKKIAIKLNGEFIGREFKVLITEKQTDYTGRNQNYKPIIIRDYKGELGEYRKVRIESLENFSLVGKILE